jgi:hypothetical protein
MALFAKAEAMLLKHAELVHFKTPTVAPSPFDSVAIG